MLEVYEGTSRALVCQSRLYLSDCIESIVAMQMKERNYGRLFGLFALLMLGMEHLS